MTTEAIYERLTRLLRAIFADDTIVATPALGAMDVDGWDSLSHTRVLMDIEQEFNIDLPYPAVLDAATVGDLAALIDRALAEAAPRA